MTSSETRVLFLNPHGEELIEYLKRGLGDRDIKLVTPPDQKKESLLPLLPHADALIGWGSDEEAMSLATKATLFINPGTGISQHIELFRKLQKTRSITLVNGHGNSYSVAQHTLALLLTLTNKVVSHHLKMRELSSPPGNARTEYLKNKTVGFLGYGAINTKVHRFMSGFDLQFSAYRKDWASTEATTPTAITEYSGDQLKTFFEDSDIVINSLPTTQQTRNLITLRELKLLGEKGLFLNVGRAATVVQEDLYIALRDQLIGGAALDVWWGKGSKPESDRHDPYQFPFHELNNLVMSPHRAADSGGDLDRWNEVIENLIRLHDGSGDFINRVDIDQEY
jgi:phosphoglycerate dehydrogenase-like enzyme